MTDKVDELREDIRGSIMHPEPEDIDNILALITQQQHLLLDRVEQSINNHTVPEGKDLITRSYVQNTIEFERNAIKESL